MDRKTLAMMCVIKECSDYFSVEYKSHQLAEQASKKLPGALANMDTWIKKYQLVHQDLRLNNE